MKVLIVSDTHKLDANLRAAIRKEMPFDIMIHLGDTEGSEIYFDDWIRNDGCFTYAVRGNNDFLSFLPTERIIRVGKYKVLLTHGHTYGVSMSTERLRDEAKARGVDMVMFGHSHRPHLTRKDDIICLNPGSFLFFEPGRLHRGTKSSMEQVSFYWFHFQGKLPQEFAAGFPVFYP